MTCAQAMEGTQIRRVRADLARYEERSGSAIVRAADARPQRGTVRVDRG